MSLRTWASSLSNYLGDYSDPHLDHKKYEQDVVSAGAGSGRCARGCTACAAQRMRHGAGRRGGEDQEVLARGRDVVVKAERGNGARRLEAGNDASGDGAQALEIILHLRSAPFPAPTAQAS